MFCRGTSDNRLRVLHLMMLAAVSRSLANHHMLAMTLAAVFSQRDIASSFVEAREASPGQKRENSQCHDTDYPQAMFLTSFHHASFFLSSPRIPVNPWVRSSAKV